MGACDLVWVRKSDVSDEKREPLWWEGMTGKELTELYDRVYGPMGGEDPDTREFQREAARRAFARSERAD